MNPVYNSHVLMLYILLDKTNTNKFSFYEFGFDLIGKGFEYNLCTFLKNCCTCAINLHFVYSQYHGEYLSSVLHWEAFTPFICTTQ